MKYPRRIKGLHDVDTTRVSRDQIRFVDIYFSGACNLNCIYCFTNHDKGKLTTLDRKGLLTQAKALGAETFVATGAGEPLLDEGFREVISHADKLGMTSAIYTNGHYITSETAKFLYNHNVSPLVKLESLDPNIHDSITRKEGSQKKVIEALENLRLAGYGQVSGGLTRLGVASVYTALNIEGFFDLKKYCDEKGILFMADELGLERKAHENRKDLFVVKPIVDKVKAELGIVESGIGYPHSREEMTCNFADYGIRIDQNGNVSYCTMQDLGNTVGNVLEKGLETVIYGVGIAKRIAIREKRKTINQVNEALIRNKIPYEIGFPLGTCPFKAGDNLEVRSRDSLPILENELRR